MATNIKLSQALRGNQNAKKDGVSSSKARNAVGKIGSKIGGMKEAVSFARDGAKSGMATAKRKNDWAIKKENLTSTVKSKLSSVGLMKAETPEQKAKTAKENAASRRKTTITEVKKGAKAGLEKANYSQAGENAGKAKAEAIYDSVAAKASALKTKASEVASSAASQVKDSAKSAAEKIKSKVKKGGTPTERSLMKR